jgi:sensor domain CHASE-containing protein
MKKTRTEQDMDLVEKTWNDLDKVVLDVMEMAKDNDVVLSSTGHDLLEKARAMCADLNLLKKQISPLFNNNSPLLWFIEEQGRRIGCSYGLIGAETNGLMTHDLRLISHKDRVYSGQCNDPAQATVQFDLQRWSRSRDCVEAYTRQKGQHDWEILKIPNY